MHGRGSAVEREAEDGIICRVLTGPTGSGKSELAMALAEKKGWEILCMDSMQIYRRMDIGTAKPTAEDRARVPHHLLDICEPTDAFSASAYRDRAEALVKELWRQGRQVLFVGGTGLYLRALMHPMAMGTVAANEPLRQALKKRAEESGGREALWERLRAADPDTARRLPVNDVRRIIRALEVTETTGIPFSRQPEREIPSPFQWRVVATELPRPVLYERINARVDRMLDAGLAGEVAALLREGVPEHAQSMAGLGYKEMIPYLKGQRSLEETAEAIRLGTRHYAKRQMTFQRREPATVYLDVTAPEAEKRLAALLEGRNG